MIRRVLTGIVACALLAVLATASSAAAKVLRVGTYHGVKGQYKTIQAAVNAAKPGDWVLVGPGDYKTTASQSVNSVDGPLPAGVLITTAKLRLRGMNRNTVIVDGTKSGPPCNGVAADQNYGAMTSQGTTGLNGIMVWKANDVWVQNLTSCNFLGGAAGDGATGNEIWWNGGVDSGQVGGWNYLGSYLNATNRFYDNENTAAEYGIFSSNWSGGTWYHTYASNFNDSGYYIGACQQVCDQNVIQAWGEYNALGYSGSNSGGWLVVRDSQFDNNEDGFDTNSQNGDDPPPQNGACPNNGTSPITHTHSCWVFEDNDVHDNNNPNVPTAGSAAAGPVGTGISISGGRNDTIMDNTFSHNDAWGTVFVPYPDSGSPCTGGTQTQAACLFDESGDALIDNKYSDNGSYGNSTNGDFAEVNLEPGPTDCYRGNTDNGNAATSSPSTLATTNPTCNGQTVAPNLNPVFLDQVACDSENASLAGLAAGTVCVPGQSSYPRQTAVQVRPLPPAKDLISMPNACLGVPVNPWCPGKHKKPGKHKHKAHKQTNTVSY
jgi:hypothetical protein